jgi:integrase
MAKASNAASADDPDGRLNQRRGHKRANGEGTIYQRKDGRWEGAAYVLTTGGAFKRIRIYGRTREEARKNLTRAIEQSDQGIPVASKSWTVSEYLIYWLEHIVKAERRPKTYQGYEGVVRRHLIPGLGKKRLAKLTAQDVRIFITQLRNECQCCKHGWDAERDEPRCCALKGGQCCASKLSVRMVQWIHSVLRNALQCAVREELLPRNVATLVKVSVPNYRVNRGLSVAEARRVLKLGKDERLYALYVLALGLGLRRGELLGLRWPDVNLAAGTLEVVQTLQRVGGQLRFVPPRRKTRRGQSRCRTSA